MNGQTNEYILAMQAALSLIRAEEIASGLALLRDAREGGHGVYLCGNGGSAATASHLAVDLGRNTGRGMRAVSLTDNVPWLTAAANDEHYRECFADQLRCLLRPKDLVIGISASGDSENVVRAFEVAQASGARRLAMIGFNGGRLAKLATGRIWVDSHDYGIVESVHGFVAHMLVRTLATEAEEDGAVLASCSMPVGAVALTPSSRPTNAETEALSPTTPGNAPFGRAT